MRISRVGKHWEREGYEWIHHDYNVLGGNRPGKFLKAEGILKEIVGSERLEELRKLFDVLTPLDGQGHNAFEEPDLLIYKRATKEIRFAECKRAGSRDTVNPRQAIGLYLPGLALRCPAEVFVVAEKGSSPSLDPITFRFPEEK